MLKNSLLFVATLSWSLAFAAQEQAFVQRGSTIVCRNARFEFLTPTMGRIEFSPGNRFVDDPTAVVLNRIFPPCTVEGVEHDGWLVMKTAKVTLQYRISSGRFSAENLKLVWNDRNVEHSWHPGQEDTGNLGGVAHSLDGVRQNNPPKFPPGILSRNGYFILDDSKSPTWNKSTKWIEPRKEPQNQDWYWFVYGDNYAQALKEYTDLTGKIPMIPRYAFGTWITDLNYEYLPGSDLTVKYHYTDTDVKSLVTRFRDEKIPLDILVLDFAWHKFGWNGGYDWSPIFPDSKGFLQWAHENGFKISTNDHPGYAHEGVLSTEDSHAPEIVHELNIAQPPKAMFTVDFSRDWKFKTDPTSIGISEKWYSVDFSDSAWKTIQAGIDWENQGFPGYDGLGWYRKKVRFPEVPEGTPILLMFGGVDDEYDLYINGSKVAHYGSPGNSMWGSLTSTEVSSLLKKGTDNLIALQVNGWGGGGGISKTPIAFTDKLPFQGIQFNLADKKQATVFMNVLHHPLVDEGVDFWWIDGGRGSCLMDGLDAQMWTNRVFYDFTEQHTKKRAFVFSRYGGWGNHRYPGIFTGDTYSEWGVLSSEVVYSAQSGNVLMPYVTHDIGGFLGQKIAFDLYARWIQFGVFNPLLRLHSAFENPKDGNLRMPWNYGQQGTDFVRKYFDMRYQLLPYIYSYSRTAYDSALPLNRPLYLEYPDLDQAYKHPTEYFFGREFLCAPIVDSTGERDVYLPPGNWFDYFSDRVVEGERTIHVKHPLETFPLFVKDGSIIPTQSVVAYSDQRPIDSLTIDVYGSSAARFYLYEDDGTSLDYRLNKNTAWTLLSSRRTEGRGQEITVGPTKGKFKGQSNARAFEFRLHGFKMPAEVSVNGHIILRNVKGGQGWSWEEQSSVVNVCLAPLSIRDRVTIIVQ